jgi:DNA repair exonuclease SbcCD ATPase subunit
VKLRHLRIENFKCLRSPLELRDFADGINLFVGPNEAGKSTVAEAIRAAFFERHRSGTLEALRPWGDSTATPQVEIQFELQGQPALLRKAFLGKKRCELQLAGQQLDGQAAEDQLAALLGFRFAGKGASSAEHLGIPGLLWVRQGQSQDIAEAVRHAEDHLRHALGDSLGELTASHGDQVLKAVESQRKELLTATTGAARGAYLEASKRREALQGELQTLQRDIELYRDRVDQLATLRATHAEQMAERPWLALREQWRQAQQRLQQAQGLHEQQRAHDALLRQAGAQVQALRNQLQAMAAEHDAQRQRQQQLQTAQHALQQALSLQQSWQPRQQLAAQAYNAARLRLQQLRLAAAHQTQAGKVAALKKELTERTQNHAQASAAQEAWSQLRAQAQALALAPGQLPQLRASAAALQQAQSRLEAVATTLEFELLPGASVCMAGQTLSGVQRQTIVSRSDIEITGIGRIGVLPGGVDLDQLAQECQRRQSELQAGLQALGLPSLAAAEERERLQHQRSTEVGAAETVLAALAPAGLAALASDLSALQQRLTAAEQALAALTAPTETPDEAMLAQAEAQEQNCRYSLDMATQSLSTAQIDVSAARSQLSSAEQELAAVQATLNAAGRADKESEAQHALTDALAHLHALQQQAAELAAQLENARLPLLQQDVERLERSCTHSETSHAERAQAITRLEAELEAKGALGLEESAAQKQQELAQTTRRWLELDRRAKALDHLYQLLTQQRAQLAQRLRAPLQRHLNHYLQILFPGAQIEVDEGLAPGLLTRQGTPGGTSGNFETHSVGAREQLGIMARLAYADLLRAAGSPTLLILDDALVHSDTHRLGQMKRVLYDAASRHQILIFSCHPEAWRDLGVPMRTLGH